MAGRFRPLASWSDRSRISSKTGSMLARWPIEARSIPGSMSAIVDRGIFDQSAGKARLSGRLRGTKAIAITASIDRSHLR